MPVIWVTIFNYITHWGQTVHKIFEIWTPDKGGILTNIFTYFPTKLYHVTTQKKPSHRDSSFECSHDMFWLRNIRIILRDTPTWPINYFILEPIWYQKLIFANSLNPDKKPHLIRIQSERSQPKDQCDKLSLKYVEWFRRSCL